MRTWYIDSASRKSVKEWMSVIVLAAGNIFESQLLSS